MRIKLFDKATDWRRYKKDIMHMEQVCFSDNPNVIADEKYVRTQYCGIGVVAWLVLNSKDEAIGHCYIKTIDTLTPEDFDGFWNPVPYWGKNTYYFNSVGILPKYQGKGLATKLKEIAFDYLRQNGVRYIIGHAHEGTMFNINKKYGAKTLETYHKWYGGENTSYLYFIDLMKQNNGYSCGPYALSYLLKHSRADKYFSPYALQREMGTNPKEGTSHDQIKFWLDGMNIPYRDSYTNKLLTGLPALVNYQNGKEGHYGVITDLKCNPGRVPYVHIYDPWSGDVEEISEHIFKKNWYSLRYGKNWSLRII